MVKIKGNHIAMSNLIKVDQKENVLYIILNRPEKLNSFLEPMRQEIANIINSLHDRNDVSVCVITGTGRGFCSGGDIKVMESIIKNRDFDHIQKFLEWGKAILLGIRSLPIPVIAAVNGPAAGAGMNLALACDLRIASTRATFGQTFINIGLHPDWGGTYLLPRIVGTSRALEMFWTGRVIDAAEAAQLGIVDMVVPHEGFAKEVDALSRDIAARSRSVVSLTKKNVYEGLKTDLATVLEHEALAQSDCIQSEEAVNGINGFLRERAKRKQQKK